MLDQGVDQRFEELEDTGFAGVVFTNGLIIPEQVDKRRIAFGVDIVKETQVFLSGQGYWSQPWSQKRSVMSSQSW